MYIPPPALLAVFVAELRLNVQLVRVGDEAMLSIPPPWHVAEFWSNVQSISVGEEELLKIPPPQP